MTVPEKRLCPCGNIERLEDALYTVAGVLVPRCKACLAEETLTRQDQTQVPATAKAGDVFREFPPIGKYRVRLVLDRDRNPVLDIREYVQSDQFEGFTRRGIMLSASADLELLRDVLTDVIAARGTRGLRL